MKYLFGLLVIVNATLLLLWGMGNRNALSGNSAPSQPIKPSLIQVMPPVEMAPSKTALINPAEPNPAAGKPLAAKESPAGSDHAALPTSATVAIVSPLDDHVTQPDVDTPFCILIGQYGSELERLRGSRQLKEMGIPYTTYDDPKGKVTGYRVYLGPFSNDRTVRRARDELGRKGITDVFVLREGKNQYLSLGVFSTPKAAGYFAAGLRARGVQAKQRTDYVPVYWLLISDRENAQRLKKSHFPGYPKDEVEAVKECLAARHQASDVRSRKSDI